MNLVRTLGAIILAPLVSIGAAEAYFAITGAETLYYSGAVFVPSPLMGVVVGVAVVEVLILAVGPAEIANDG